jgi:hypothetical protein
MCTRPREQQDRRERRPVGFIATSHRLGPDRYPEVPFADDHAARDAVDRDPVDCVGLDRGAIAASTRFRTTPSGDHDRRPVEHAIGV